MSNIGVRGFYLITTTIRDNLLNDENVNTVTTGDITKVDLSKQTIYPLSHIIINTVSQDEHDILNTQLAVANKLIELLRSGTLYTNKYQLDGVVNCEPFYDRFENEVAGWVATMDILIDNDINIC